MSTRKVSKQLRLITLASLKKITRKFRNGPSEIVEDLLTRLNDYSLSREPLSPEVFRVAKAKALMSWDDQRRDAFQWKLHDADGRGATYQEWVGEECVQRWLSWYLPHHFMWVHTSDELVADLEKKITLLGRQTWARMFRRHWFYYLRGHELYSLPDIYYSCKTLGGVPDVVIDVGGGWGGLGMAWIAAGCRSVAVVDSIEQPYILQNVYLRSVPGVAFRELLESDDPSIDLSSWQGITHFSLWKLPAVKSQSVDVVSAVQVLREVNGSMIIFLVSELKRVLRPGGIFYVRDNDHSYSEASMHNVNVTQYLLEQGFELVFDPPLVQGRDIHRVPRIFRRKG